MRFEGVYFSESRLGDRLSNKAPNRPRQPQLLTVPAMVPHEEAQTLQAHAPVEHEVYRACHLYVLL